MARIGNPPPIEDLDPGVELRDGPFELPAVSDDSGVVARRVAIERQRALRDQSVGPIRDTHGMVSMS
ncbi:hypothetical protein HFP89_08565 [Wenzhouxiangella sp. XN79A]|uniref:hypothetical protein n=1 Tax=Wenzhouxiangella sp. XN79A TaxID=2724193 RepID=UPI00144A9298|nr:hypothetical protein [Wenzhouxiangella sp. XN79A]NKI35218.1 hypothetical protein [Wenzhouxiangella sp. XN79A]